MNTFFAGVILLVGLLFLWLGLQVELGYRKPKPTDKFFSLFGRNIDYVIGVSGIFVGVGILVSLLAVSFVVAPLAGAGAGFILAGVVRAYLPAKHFGPKWARKTAKNY